MCLPGCTVVRCYGCQVIRSVMNVHSVDYSTQCHMPSGMLNSCFGALWTQFEAACFVLLGRLLEGWTEDGTQHDQDLVGHEQTESSCLF